MSDVTYLQPRPRICECDEHSEYLFADIDGWHCEKCSRLVPRDATNHPTDPKETR